MSKKESHAYLVSLYILKEQVQENKKWFTKGTEVSKSTGRVFIWSHSGDTQNTAGAWAVVCHSSVCPWASTMAQGAVTPTLRAQIGGGVEANVNLTLVTKPGSNLSKVNL